MYEDDRTCKQKQESRHRSAYLADRCYLHMKALLVHLKIGMDRRSQEREVLNEVAQRFCL